MVDNNCNICNRTLSSYNRYYNHINSNKHKKNLLKLYFNTQEIIPEITPEITLEEYLKKYYIFNTPEITPEITLEEYLKKYYITTDNKNDKLYTSTITDEINKNKIFNYNIDAKNVGIILNKLKIGIYNPKLSIKSVRKGGFSNIKYNYFD